MTGPVRSTLLTGGAAFALTLAILPLVRRVALAYGVMDRPNARKLHAQPVPYMGGVAIAVVALFLSSFLSGWRAEAAVIIGAALLVGAVGLIDDIRNLNPGPRLAVEVLAAVMAASAGARVAILRNPIDWVVTIVAIVILTNAFNLLDNMDGAAGIIATTTAVGLAVTATGQGQVLVGGLAALLAGSCFAFLLHNRPPATIFLGDAGSLFVGFLLATIALKLRFDVGHRQSIVAVLFFTAPALFDTTLVTISRVRAGRSIYTGGKDHTSHRLLALRLSQNQVMLVLAGACATSTTLGVLVGRGHFPAWVVGPALVLGLGVLLLLLRVPVYAEGVEAPKNAPAGINRGT